jgi:ADP-heptose:LPS heptosyltransferase
MKTFAIIPSKGLGDLLVCLGLAYNLSSTYQVKIFHPLITQIKDLVPYAQVHDRPEDFESMALNNIDECLIIYEDSPFFKQFQPKLNAYFGSHLFVLNPVVTDKKDYIYSDNYFFNSKLSFSENLLIFAQEHFLQHVIRKSAGVNLKLQKDKKLIVMHVTASKETKSWFNHRFLYVKKKLEKKGFRIVFATLPHETKAIAEGLYSGLQSLSELVDCLCRASLVIGNESGVCHLASALNTPSIVLSRNPRIQKFWGADYEGRCFPLFPLQWIPNIKNLRLRDKYWKAFIFKSKVYKKALSVLKESLTT